jgi:hypothetical protein
VQRNRNKPRRTHDRVVETKRGAGARLGHTRNDRVCERQNGNTQSETEDTCASDHVRPEWHRMWAAPDPANPSCRSQRSLTISHRVPITVVHRPSRSANSSSIETGSRITAVHNAEYFSSCWTYRTTLNYNPNMPK